MKVFDPPLLRLFPYHRGKEKRSQLLTLDELIDDYRRLHTLSNADFDFLLMAYRYEHPFQKFFKSFMRAKLKPAELIDLLRLSFAALLTRHEENIPQLAHALVESSKKIFGPHTATLVNAFARRVLREKAEILAHLEKNPAEILGPTLAERWKASPELTRRFALKVAERPSSGIGVLQRDGRYAVIPQKDFREGETLALSAGSYALVKWMSEKIAVARPQNFLDLCAAPGGKCIGFLQLLEETPQKVIAVDAKFKRIERLKENLQHWRLADKVRPLLHDWTQTPKNSELAEEQKWELLLADLPCTGLGTLASRPDLLLENWSVSDEQLFALQATIIAEGRKRMAPGSSFFVSICSSDPQEVAHVSQLLEAPPAFQAALSEHNTEEITAWRVLLPDA